VPVLLTLFVLTVGSLALYLATGILAPLGIIGIFFLPFFWYLVIAGVLVRASRI
jgi:hypothetical protein